MEATDELPTVAQRDPPVLGRYRLGPRLGSGGFGTVYAAHDMRLDREVAVKVIPTSAPAPERASREGLAAARLDHPGIVAVFDAGEDHEARYLVSELVHGRTLDRLAADGELSDRDVLRVGLALAGALQHAHERGVIHRDVKPQNVIVPDRPRSPRSAAKLADFGVAHLADDVSLTRTGDVVGTLAYMAPEQADGKRVDERADLYSLALVLYEGLAGVNPVRAGSPAATARKVGTVLPALQKKRKDLPPELCAALDRALRPRPEDRGTLHELADELAEGLTAVSDEGGTVLAHPLERVGTPFVPPLPGRIAAALIAGGLAAALADYAGDVEPWMTGAAAAAVIGLLPRLGWVALVVAAFAWLAPDRPGAAVLIVGAALPVPLIRGTGRAWWLPAAAPLLPPAYVAIAGRAQTALQRAALGAVGAWWLLLADADRPKGWAQDAELTFDAILAPPFSSGLIAVAGVWAVCAAILPWLVRGRYASTDFVGAAAWAAGLGAGTAAVAEWAGATSWDTVTAGAVVAGALAVFVPRALPRDIVDA